MPETEAIFDEGGMAPRPESGLYGLPADEGGTPPATPLLGSGPEEGRPAAPGQTSAEGQEKQPAADDAARLEAHLRQTDALRRARWQQQVEQWRQEVADDPQLGGEHLAATVARAQLALDRFDTDKSIGRLLEESGYGQPPGRAALLQPPGRQPAGRQPARQRRRRQPAAPGRTHVRGLELAAILTMQVANRHTAFSPFRRFVPGR